MFDDFLSDLLKIIVVLDILGLIAYFFLGMLRKKQCVDKVARTNSANESTGRSFSEHFKPLFENKIENSHDTASLRQRLIDYRTNRRRQKRSNSSSRSDLESSFADLRRVLNSYCEGIAWLYRTIYSGSPIPCICSQPLLILQSPSTFW